MNLRDDGQFVAVGTLEEERGGLGAALEALEEESTGASSLAMLPVERFSRSRSMLKASFSFRQYRTAMLALRGPPQTGQ
jgi:hypothetical protein